MARAGTPRIKMSRGATGLQTRGHIADTVTTATLMADTSMTLRPRWRSS
jgi:hypothetical protein